MMNNYSNIIFVYVLKVLLDIVFIVDEIVMSNCGVFSFMEYICL